MKNYKVFLKLIALTGRAGHGLDYLLKRFFQETCVFSQNVFFFRGSCGKTIVLPCFPQYFLQRRRNKKSLEWFSVLETSSYIYMI